MATMSEIRGYGLAALSFGAALALAFWIGAPAPCFFLAVAVSCLYGGRGPGFLSIALSAVAFGYFFLPARLRLREELFSFGQLALFLAALVTIAAIVEYLQGELRRTG